MLEKLDFRKTQQSFANEQFKLPKFYFILVSDCILQSCISGAYLIAMRCLYRFNWCWVCLPLG